MPGLSRREFIASVGALSAAWGLSPQMLGSALAAPAAPSDARTTLLETIRMSPTAYKQYRTLVTTPGEEYIARVDILGREPSPTRAKDRRSLVYLGHFSDIHVLDVQSPATLETMAGQDPYLWAGVCRAQEALTVHVQSAMVSSMAGARLSPLTGAPMTAAVVTGDSADQHSALELEWYIGIMDGKSVTPNSGAPGVYEGVQVWPESTFAYHPDDPSGTAYGEYGFPTLPGMVQAAITNPVTSVGLPVPWYAVYGNHDVTINGTLAINSQMRSWALGPRKAAVWQAQAEVFFNGLAAEASVFQRLLDTLSANFGMRSGIRAVTADPARKLYENAQFMNAHFETTPVPGPIGHGFTQRNLDTGETWWAADFGPFLRCFGLDTCNQIAGPDGAVPEDQFEWLQGELAKAQAENKLAIVISHHNSFTLENDAVPAIGPSQRLVHADEFVATLHKYPNMVAWLNGHTHNNTITAHIREDGGGFWEITTASCVDFPQQQQVVELVDNRDGTMSIFTTVLDHASPADYKDGDFSQVGLASLSRQLAANDWTMNPGMRMGSELDRNCELLLPAPFDLSTISDADLDKAQAEARARLVAYEQGVAS